MLAAIHAVLWVQMAVVPPGTTGAVAVTPVVPETAATAVPGAVGGVVGPQPSGAAVPLTSTQVVPQVGTQVGPANATQSSTGPSALGSSSSSGSPSPEAPLTDRSAPARPALAGPGMAAAPALMSFAVINRKVERPSKLILSLWSEAPGLTYSALVADPDANWLSVKRIGKSKSKPDRYEVSIEGKALSPGEHKSSIEVTAAGARNSPLKIPVTVSVRGKGR